MTPVGKKAILCGSGELGKEVALELQRFGVEVIALDKYANAPAMQVAHRSYVLSMLDGERLREIIEKEKPDYIIPEVEAIATPTPVALVPPSASWSVALLSPCCWASSAPTTPATPRLPLSWPA